MKKIASLLLLSLMFISCAEDEVIVNRFRSIQVYAYEFDVPEDFQVEYVAGFDSSPGFITGPDYVLEFDFGFFSGGPDFSPSAEFYDLEEETFGTHLRQIAVAKNPETHRTIINFYNTVIQPSGFVGGVTEGYITLYMRPTTILTAAQNEEVIGILRSGRLY